MARNSRATYTRSNTTRLREAQEKEECDGCDPHCPISDAFAPELTIVFRMEVKLLERDEEYREREQQVERRLAAEDILGHERRENDKEKCPRKMAGLPVREHLIPKMAGTEFAARPSER